MEQNKSNIKAGIILLLIVLVLLYLLTLGKADLLTENREERKRKLAEKKKLLEDRYNRVQNILNKKKGLKTKLETVCKRVLFGVRLSLAMLVVGGICISNLIFSVSFLVIGEYIGLLTLGLLLVGFVFIGGPTDFFKIWSYFEKKLTLKIYGKYINIDKHIETHESELQQIITDKKAVENDLHGILRLDFEIENILEERN